MKYIFTLLLCMGLIAPLFSQVQMVSHTKVKETDKIKENPLRVGVIGLVHTHVHWILGREERGDIEIVGIVEPNRELAQRYSEQHGYSMDIVFDSMQEMIEKTKPEAVTAFNTIYDHLEVVEFCAPRGIDVMVEKPLAVNWEHAKSMIALAEEHGIELLTNYETSWYGSTHDAHMIAVEQGEIGDLRRLVFHTGHPGPIEIGCNPEFLEWLTDPVLNGGGALTDFGCYGANIATWMMQGATPESVYCVTQQVKPEKYPNVEDDATIVLQYPNVQVIIQASWNWPFNRKDMEVYGRDGYIICKNASDMVIKKSEGQDPSEVSASDLPENINDPFTLLNEVVKGSYTLPPFALSSLENNKIVMQILEAARISSEMGCEVKWSSLYPEK